MGARMFRKGLVVAVILLFIGVAFAPSIIADVVENKSSIATNIIIVDDEGDGDFTSIKEALSFANPGDTIEVYSGTYNEHAFIIETENITLEGIPFELGNGSDTGKPFIDGPGTDSNALIDIKACRFTINGFHIENYNVEPLGNVLIGIDQGADECVISNNDIFYTSSALVWVEGSNTIILNNNISHSLMRQGICLREPSNDNIVRGNVISDCQDGIVLWESGHNLIERNIIQNCSRFGIDNIYHYNTIQYNLCKDNLVGYHTYYGTHSTITYNNFINNEVQAHFLNSLLIYTNKWNGNYWDRGRILPYPIRGAFFIFPWIQFDWHPALVPNEI